MVEAHKKPGVLSDFILESQDGIVNVLGVILGVAIASGSFKIVLAGFAIAFLVSGGSPTG